MATKNIPLCSTYWLYHFNFCRNPSLHSSSKATVCSSFSSSKIVCKIEVNTEKFKRRLMKKGFMPTPKIIHKLKKKEIQKVKRKGKKDAEYEVPPRVKKVMEEEALFEKASREYEILMAELEDREEEYFPVNDRKYTEEEFSVGDGKITEEELSAGHRKFTEDFFVGFRKFTEEDFSVSDRKSTQKCFSVSDRHYREEELSVSERKFAEEEFSVRERKFTEKELSITERNITEEELSVRGRKFVERISVRGDEDGEISLKDDDDDELRGTKKFSVSGRRFTEEICVSGDDNEDEEISVSDRKVNEEYFVTSDDGNDEELRDTQEISVNDKKFKEIFANDRKFSEIPFTDGDDDIYDKNVVKMESKFWEMEVEIEKNKGLNSSVATFRSERHGRKRAGYRHDYSDERVKGSVRDGTFMKKISVADDNDNSDDNNGVKMEGQPWESGGEIEKKKGLNSGEGRFRPARYGRTRVGYSDEKVKGYVSDRKFTDEIFVTDDDSNDDNKGMIMEGKPWERARGIEKSKGLNSGVDNLSSVKHGKMRVSHSDARVKGFVSGRKFTEEMSVADGNNNKGVKIKGKPLERARITEKRKGLNSEVANSRSGRQGGMRASHSDIDERVKGKGENLKEFREMLLKHGKGEFEDLNWLLDDDLGDADLGSGNDEDSKWEVRERSRSPIDEEKEIQWLTERLNSVNVKMPTWQLSNLMHSARMKFTDGRLVKIVQVLGDLGNWRKAVEVVHWVHNRKRYMYCKGRYVYTTLLAVLGKARRPIEALNVFHAMREHISSYPDMPAYRCIATILGQAGYLKELLNIIDCLHTGPANLMKNVKFLHWDPRLEPDVVVYNAVLNACVPWKQWKGAFWVLQEMRQKGLRPSCATYGLAIEVMLASGKYEMVHMLFEKMGKAGLTPNALTYKAIVRAFWKEEKTDEAVRAVEEMNCRGVVPTASVYYELASGLCSAGRWQDAQFQVEKLCKCPPVKPLAVTFTGLIQCCAEAGHIHDCVSIFKYMQEFCAPNIGTVNAMIKAYGQNNMFQEAKVLFEGIKKGRIGQQNPVSIDPKISPDIFTYNAMLEACAVADEWEYVENVYKQMVLHGHSIDQNRHAWLMVAASRAGKSHLLDHAFDQLLRQGKIPHISLYKEKICRSLQSEEYDKVINFINIMAKGSMDISKNDWTELFKKNTNRISKDRLRDLSEELNNFVADDILKSSIFNNLIESLHLLCGLDTSSEPLKTINNLRTMKYDEEDHSYANSMSLYSAGEHDKVKGYIRNQYIITGNGGVNEQNLKLGTENDTMSPFVTEEVEYDIDKFGDPNLPSSDEILMEWKQDVREKSLVQC